jgi:hypothetical protein
MKCRPSILASVLVSLLVACQLARPAQLATNNAANRSTPVSLDQLGAVAGKQYRGDGLSVSATPDGARLRCVFQRLEGQATPEGRWLTSTAGKAQGERLRVVAAAVRRATVAGRSYTGLPTCRTDFPIGSASAAPRGAGLETGLETCDSKPLEVWATKLSRTGTVSVDGQAVRFTRPGLTEEYSVSLEGVRQDFVVLEKPAGEGELRVGLEVNGAQVEAMQGGVRLVLEQSGRKLAYSRLRATDATGRELSARMDVLTSNPESRRHKPEISQSLLTSAATEPSLAVLVNDADAVYPVRIDPTFSDANWVSMNPGMPGADNGIRAITVDGSGNVYVGGDFTVIGTVAANHIAKWNGSAWSALGTGMNSYVMGLALSGTDLYAGGVFTTAGGVTANHIAKWDGSAWSALGVGMDSTVYALSASGTDLYAGGVFTTAGGMAANYIARWNGSAWSALGSGMGGGDGSQTYLSALVAMGTDLYAGGNFTMAGGVAANRVAKWDGSAWSVLGAGMNSYVMGLALSGTNLYAAGNFTTAGGVTANHIAKWDGSAWSALGAGLNDDPYTVAASATDVYAAGFFTTAGGVAANFIARWNGSAWSALGSGMDSSVSALAVSGATLYAGGQFVTAGEVRGNHIAAWDGSDWSALGSGMDFYVSTLAASGSDLYAGGAFTTAGGLASNNVAKWGGSAWLMLGPGMNSSVQALAVSGSGVYAGGYFTTVGGSAANRIAKWNGSAWSALGSGMNAPVHALAVSGSDVYAGGSFTNAGGSAANHIAKWDGSAWLALGSGMSGRGFASGPVVSALAVSGSDVYAGGDFTMAGGIAATNIAKWNGSAWSALGSWVDVRYQVFALAVSGSDLYAVGGPSVVSDPYYTNFVAKWDGSDWSVLGGWVGYDVFALAVSGSDLYAGGNFTNAGGSAVNYIAKWNGSSWSALGSGMNAPVSALVVTGSDLYAGGGFTAAGRKVSVYVAKAIAIPGDWLRIQKGVPGPGTNTLNYVGVPNAEYLVQLATNLSTGPWFTLATNTAGADGRGTVIDSRATNSQRFYRISTP